MIELPDIQGDTECFAGSAGVGVPHKLKQVQGDDSRMFEEISVSPRSLSLNEEGESVVFEHRESGSPVEHRESGSPVDDYLPHAVGSCEGSKISPYFLDLDPRTSGIVMHFHDSALFFIANNNRQDVVHRKEMSRSRPLES